MPAIPDSDTKEGFARASAWVRRISSLRSLVSGTQALTPLFTNGSADAKPYRYVTKWPEHRAGRPPASGGAHHAASSPNVAAAAGADSRQIGATMTKRLSRPVLARSPFDAASNSVLVYQPM